MLSRISVIVCAAWISSASQPVETVQDSTPRLWTITLSAQMDGSGVFHFSDDGLTYDHKHWGTPTGVLFNGQHWEELSRTPVGWQVLRGNLALSQAWVVRRSGRDTVAFEKTSKGFDVYFNDSPNGADEYTITISIPLIEQTL